MEGETAVMNGGEIGYKWIPPAHHSLIFGEGQVIVAVGGM